MLGSETMDQRIAELRKIANLSIEDWRFKWGDFLGPERTDFDDSDWRVVDTDYRWFPPDSKAWYRKWIEIPQEIGGLDATGSKLNLVFSIDDEGILYVNGRLVERFHSQSEPILLTESAQPGERFLLAVQNVNRALHGQLIMAELHSERSEEVVQRIREYLANFDEIMRLVLAGSERSERDLCAEKSVRSISIERLRGGGVEGFIATLNEAQRRLMDAQEISMRKTRKLGGLVRQRLCELSDLLKEAQGCGIDTSYPAVSKTVIENFMEFAVDDMKSGETDKVMRAASTMDYLLSSCNRTLGEIGEYLKEPSKAPRVPRYRTGPVEIKNGAFQQGDTPIFFTGFGHFAQVRKDIAKLPSYGFNIIQVVIDAAHVLSGPDETNTTPIDGLVRVLDRAAENNVAVNVLLGPGFPSWAYEADPTLRTNYPGFLKFNVDHAMAREVVGRYLEALIPRIAGHPALFSYDLTNEPTYTDDSKYSLDGYDGWLERRHGTIKELNQRYATACGRFEDIPIPTEDSVRGAWHDWCLYNQDRFFGYHGWMKKVIRTMDPTTPIHVKVQGTAFDAQRWFQLGINHEDFARMDRISGNDNYSYHRAGLGEEYAEGWLRQAMYYDLQRSVAPDNPIFNSENHPIRDSDPVWVSGDHMTTMLWQGAVHGQGATTTWVWERREQGCTNNNILTRPNCVEAFGRAALDLVRLGKYVVALQRGKSEVALLYCPSSIPLFDPYLDEMRKAYEGLYFQDSFIVFVSDRQVVDGWLPRCKLLIAPRVAYVSDRVVEEVVRFCRCGGTLLTVGDAFRYDEYGSERRDNALLPPGQTTSKEFVWHLGKGMVIHRAASMEPKEYARILDDWMDRAGVVRSIRVMDDHNHPVWGVCARAVELDGRFIVYLVNLLSKERTVRLMSEEPIGEVVNLIDGKTSGSLFELASLQPMLLSVQTL